MHEICKRYFWRRHKRNWAVRVNRARLKPSVDIDVAIAKKSVGDHSRDRATSDCILIASVCLQGRCNASFRAQPVAALV